MSASLPIPTQSDLLALIGTVIFWTEDNGLLNEGVVVKVATLSPGLVIVQSMDGLLRPVK